MIMFTCEPRRILRQLTIAKQAAASVLFHGVIDLFRRPRTAPRYWSRIARAARFPADGDSEELLGLPRGTMDQIIPGAESIPVTLIDYNYNYGDIPVHELITLCRIVRYKQPDCIFEIGTYLGGTTLQLAANSRGEVYTLDLPPRGHKDYVQPQTWDPDSDVYPDQPGVRFEGTTYADRIHQLFGNSQTYDFTPYSRRVDFVFVDGCHHYQFVLCDSENALKMMSHDGVVVWHDYASYAPGVVQALNELSKAVPLVQIAGTSLVIYHP